MRERNPNPELEDLEQDIDEYLGVNDVPTFRIQKLPSFQRPMSSYSNVPRRARPVELEARNNAYLKELEEERIRRSTANKDSGEERSAMFEEVELPPAPVLPMAQHAVQMDNLPPMPPSLRNEAGDGHPQSPPVLPRRDDSDRPMGWEDL